MPDIHKNMHKALAFLLGLGAIVSGTQTEPVSGGDLPELAWSKVIGGPGATSLGSVGRDAQGDLVVAGAIYAADSPLAMDVYVAKINPAGEVIWETGLDHDLGDEGFGVTVSRGRYIIVGASGGDRPCGLDCIGFIERPDIYVAQLEDSGKIVWQSKFGGAHIDAGRAVVAKSTGDYVIVGQTRSFGKGLDDVIVVKVDMSGKLLWQKTFGGEKADIGYGITAAQTGGFVIVGKSASFSEWSNLYIVRIDEQGELLWEKTAAETTETRSGRAVIQSSDGRYAIGGTRGNSGHITMIDSNGDVLWERSLGGPSEINDIVQSDDGMLLAAGTKVKNDNDFDVYVARLDTHGMTVQDVVYGSESHNERVFAIVATESGGYVMVGDSQQGDAQKGYVAKLIISDRPFLRGDTDRNESISISDGIGILSFLFQGGESLSCPDAADANDDGRVNIVDAIAIIVYLFQGGSQLPEPAHHLGIDPTPDELSCPRL